MGVGDPYIHILRQHGITFDNGRQVGKMIAISKKPAIKGRSKLKKWSCPCGQNVRVGKKDFFATCDLCKEKFELCA